MNGIDFDRLAAVARLRGLAATPIDLRAPGTLTPERLRGYVCRGAGFELLYATQPVNEQVLDALQALADEAGLVAQYEAMRRGEVLNRIEGWPSEDRQVLHTASRDVFSPGPACPEAAGLAREQLGRLRDFLAALDEGRLCNDRGEAFHTMVQVGIGGSDLGPRALCLALQAYARPGRQARFIANVDPDDAAAVLADLELSRTLFNVVSKSGSTLETLTNESLVRAALQGAGLDPARHLIAVTGAGSPMDDPTRYRASFHMYDFIGGRYSATSMVGAVTLGFVLGYEAVGEILRGAHAMDLAASEPDIRANPPLLMALLGIWQRNFLGHQTVAILPYSQALSRFPAHLQQCDMESNGKSASRGGRPVEWATGPIVWGEPGTNGQHAFYQLLHQGTTVVPAEFIGFRRSQYGRDLAVQGTSSQEKLLANMLAQCLALALGKEDDNPNRRFSGNRPSLLLLADHLDPRTMGALLALYEARIVFQGFTWNINSFDQEGVQLGKLLATRLLAAMAGSETAAAALSPVERELLRLAAVPHRASSEANAR